MSYLRLPLLAFVVLLVATFSVGTTSLAMAAEESVAESAEAVDGDGDHVEGVHDDDADMPPILSFDPGAAAVNLAIFLGTFLILAKFVWPVILGGLKAREEKIASDLQRAQAANETAAAKLNQYEQKLSDAASEAQAVMAEARRDAETSAAKIVEQAKAEAQRQSDRALADIETAKKVALADIASQTSSLAMSVAKQVVGRELNAEDHADLIRKALDQVPSQN